MRWTAVGVAAVLFASCHSGSSRPSTAPLTAAPGAKSPSTAPPPTTQPIVTGAGALITPPLQPTIKPLDPNPSCPALIDRDQGFDGSCQTITTKAGTAALVDEQQPVN